MWFLFSCYNCLRHVKTLSIVKAFSFVDEWYSTKYGVDTLLIGIHRTYSVCATVLFNLGLTVHPNVTLLNKLKQDTNLLVTMSAAVSE